MNIKKRILTIILLLCVFFPCVSLSVGCKYDKGVSISEVSSWVVGTEENAGYYLLDKEGFLDFVDIVNNCVTDSGWNYERKFIIKDKSGKIQDKELNPCDILSANYKIIENIDLSESVINSIGSNIYRYGNSREDDGCLGLEYSANKGFNGIFDGNGYKISNFGMLGGVRDYDEDNITTGAASYMTFYDHFTYANGFFATLGSNAIVKNLWLDNYNIILDELQNQPYGLDQPVRLNGRRALILGGGVCGYANEGARIEQCKITNLGIGYLRYVSTKMIFRPEEIVKCGVSAICGMGQAEILNCEVHSFNVIEQESGTLKDLNLDINESNYNYEHVSVQAFKTAFSEVNLKVGKKNWGFLGNWQDNKVSNCVGQNLKIFYRYGNGYKDNSEENPDIGLNVNNYQIKSAKDGHEVTSIVGNFDSYSLPTNDYVNYPWYSYDSNGFLTLQRFLNKKEVKLETVYDEYGNSLITYKLNDEKTEEELVLENNKFEILAEYDYNLLDDYLPKSNNDSFANILNNIRITIQLENFMPNVEGASLYLNKDTTINDCDVFVPKFDFSNTNILFYDLNDNDSNPNPIKQFNIDESKDDIEYSYSLEDFVVDDTNKIVYLGEEISKDEFLENNKLYESYEVINYSENSMNLTAPEEGLKLINNVYQWEFNTKELKLVELKFIDQVIYTIPSGLTLKRDYKELKRPDLNENYKIKIKPFVVTKYDISNDGTINVLLYQYINGKKSPLNLNQTFFNSKIHLGDKFVVKHNKEDLVYYFRTINPVDDEIDFEKCSNLIGLEKIEIKESGGTSTILSLDNELETFVYKTHTEITFYYTMEFDNVTTIKVGPATIDSNLLYPYIIGYKENAIIKIEKLEKSTNIYGNFSFEHTIVKGFDTEIANETSENTTFTISGPFYESFSGCDTIKIKYYHGKGYEMDVSKLAIYPKTENKSMVINVKPTFETTGLIAFLMPAQHVDLLGVSNFRPSNLLIDYNGSITFNTIKTKYKDLYPDGDNNKSGMKVVGFEIKALDENGDIIEYKKEYFELENENLENEYIKSFDKIKNITTSIEITPLYEDIYHNVTLRYNDNLVQGELGEIVLKVKHNGKFVPTQLQGNKSVTLVTKTSNDEVIAVNMLYAEDGFMYSGYRFENDVYKDFATEKDNIDGKHFYGLDYITGDICLYLEFEQVVYSIIFLGVDGTSMTSSQEVNVIKDATIEVEKISTNGVKFIVPGYGTIVYNSDDLGYQGYLIGGQCSNWCSDYFVVESSCMITPIFINNPGLLYVSLNGVDDNGKDFNISDSVSSGTDITFAYNMDENSNKETFVVSPSGYSDISYTTKNGGTGENSSRWVFDYAQILFGGETLYFRAYEGQLYYSKNLADLSSMPGEESKLPDDFKLTIDTTEGSLKNILHVQIYFARVYNLTFAKNGIIKNDVGYEMSELVVYNQEGNQFTETIISSDYGIDLVSTYAYQKGSTSELFIFTNTDHASLINYTISRYYKCVGYRLIVDGLELEPISFEDKVNFNYELKYGIDFKIEPIIEFNAIKLTLNYDLTKTYSINQNDNYEKTNQESQTDIIYSYIKQTLLEDGSYKDDRIRTITTKFENLYTCGKATHSKCDHDKFKYAINENQDPERVNIKGNLYYAFNLGEVSKDTNEITLYLELGSTISYSYATLDYEFDSITNKFEITQYVHQLKITEPETDKKIWLGFISPYALNELGHDSTYKGNYTDVEGYSSKKNKNGVITSESYEMNIVQYLTISLGFGSKRS